VHVRLHVPEKTSSL